jgi:spore coat polysaccharide biosynthesis protein SpsF (cytidylyltransferase family)
MNRTTGIIIQARKSSSRFPGKILLPFYKEESILDIILKKLSNIIHEIPVIVATSTNPADDEIVDSVTKYPEIKIFRGDEQNVLNRFIEAARKYRLTSVIRLCSDNLFVDTELIKSLIVNAGSDKWDYVSFKIAGDIPVIKSHQGFYTEWISLKTLEKVSNMTKEKIYIEHVTNFIYSHPDIFKVRLDPAPQILYNLNGLRLTIDTAIDFTNSQIVYSKLADAKQEISYQNVLGIVLSDVKLMDSMREQIRLNSK